MKLFEPTCIGPLELKNRLVMTAMSTWLARAQGGGTDRLTEYYAVRAAGGVGMVTVEEASIHPQLPHVPKMPGADLPHVTTAHDVLAGKVAIGKSPVAVIGGFGKSCA